MADTGTNIGQEGAVYRSIGGKIWSRLYKDRLIYLLVMPGALYYLIFKILPMIGVVIAFQDYSPFGRLLDNEWVGFAHFARIFEDAEVIRVLWNTLYISFVQILFVFPAPILLSLMLNEVSSSRFKRLVQSILYLPHFISWVVIISIVTLFLKSDGLINKLLESMGVDWVSFLTTPSFFVPIVVLEILWKETGWGTIIFLAALAGLNQDLIEASVIDGANRWRRIWHVVLPSIRSTIVILLILRLGTVLDTGFEQIFLMLNPFNMHVGNVLDTYVYYKGIQQSDYSFSTAVGLFKGIVGMVLVMIANRLAKRFGEEGIY